jgi:RNA polymerase sigma factor (sigma-70 family)
MIDNMTDLDDTALLNLYHKTKDETYFSALYHRNWKPLCKTLHGLIFDVNLRERIEDILQDTFTSLHFSKREITSVRTWLLRTAKRRATDMIRSHTSKKRGRGFAILNLSQIDQYICGKDSVQEITDAETTDKTCEQMKALASRLPKLIKMLPVEYQQVVRLFLDGKSERQAAKLLGISRSYVYDRLENAVIELKRLHETYSV